MKVTRRAFIATLLVSPRTAENVRVAVLEVFALKGSAMAALVRHAAPEERDSFAEWLRAHPRSAVNVQGKSGQESTATCFRVRMCFGRGLLLFDRQLSIKEGDTLTLTT
jgi:hypothetical protein